MAKQLPALSSGWEQRGHSAPSVEPHQSPYRDQIFAGRSLHPDFSDSELSEHGSVASDYDRALVALRTAIEQKSLDAKGLDLQGVCDIADYFVICSATSERHAQGIADNIRRELAKLDEEPILIDGVDTGRWIILDYGALIVHVLHHEARQYYNLDELWDKASRLPLSPELEAAAKKLRTGMYL